MKTIGYILIGMFIGWMTVGIIRAGSVYNGSYLNLNVERIVTLLERIAYNTEALR